MLHLLKHGLMSVDCKALGSCYASASGERITASAKKPFMGEMREKDDMSDDLLSIESDDEEAGLSYSRLGGGGGGQLKGWYSLDNSSGPVLFGGK